MEAAIQTLVKVFLKSTKGNESLGREKFHGLVKSQLSNILTGTDSKKAVDDLCQGLDANQDGKVGFDEYMNLIGYLAVSLSKQRSHAQEEPAQNAASGQVAQSSPGTEEANPEENPEVMEEVRQEPNREAEPEATTEVKVEGNKDGEVEVKVEVKAEGETKPEAVKVVPTAAGAAAVVEAAEVAAEEMVKEDEKKEETDKVEEAAEKLVAAVVEEAEKKTEEATS